MFHIARASLSLSMNFVANFVFLLKIVRILFWFRLFWWWPDICAWHYSLLLIKEAEWLKHLFLKLKNLRICTRWRITLLYKVLSHRHSILSKKLSASCILSACFEKQTAEMCVIYILKGTKLDIQKVHVS